MVMFSGNEGCCFRKQALLLIVVCCHELFADCYRRVGWASILRLDEPSCCLDRRGAGSGTGCHLTLAFLFQGITLREGRRRIKSFTNSLQEEMHVLREKRMAYRPARDFPPANAQSLELETRGGNGLRWDERRRWVDAMWSGWGRSARRHGSESAATMVTVAQQWR